MMHHANVLYGSIEWAKELLHDKYNHDIQPTMFRSFSRMTIADAHALMRESLLTPHDASHTIHVVHALQIMREAQNALLKMLEESKSVQFVFVIPNPTLLLQTVRSRLLVLGIEESHIVAPPEWDTFFGLAVSARLKMIQERLKAEDSKWIISILEGYALHTRDVRDSLGLKTAMQFLEYQKYPGASAKMMLEYVALSAV